MTPTSDDRVKRGIADSPLSSPRLDLPGLDETLQAFGRSRMLPAAAYTSSEVFAWELRWLFAGTYTCLGREDDLRRPGGNGARPLTQRAVMVGDVSVLVTWIDDELRAHANVCRHRAHELLEADEGNSKQSIVCPYHAWTYDLAGSLRVAPGYTSVPGFSTGDHGLVGLPVHCWHGWVFVHAATSLASGQAYDFETYIGDLEKIVSPYAPETLTLGARHTYEVAANWKVVAENYHECIHCPLIHPELCQVTPPTSGNNYNLPGAWIGGSMVLRDGMQTMSLSGKSRGRPIEGVPNGRGVRRPRPQPAHLGAPRLRHGPSARAAQCWADLDRMLLVLPRHRQRPGDRPVVRRGVLGHHQPAGLERLRVCAARPRIAARAPRPVRPGRDAVHQFAATIARAYRGLSIDVPIDGPR